MQKEQETPKEKETRLQRQADLEEEREILQAHGLDPEDEDTARQVSVRLAAADIRELRRKRAEERNKRVEKPAKKFW